MILYPELFCRYRLQGIILDIMPTGQNSLGFANSWCAWGRNNFAYCWKINTSATVSVHLEENEQRRLRMITGELTAFVNE